MKKCFEFPNKKRYNTQKDAEKAAFSCGDVDLRVYKCETCNGWHLTSKK